MFQRTVSIFLSLGLLVSVFTAQAQSKSAADSIAFDKDLRTLMQVTKAAELAMKSMNNTIDKQLESSPEMKDFWEAFRAEIKQEEFVNLLIPIYRKHYTHADVKDLIVFYQSPLGQRVVDALPGITVESQEAGMKWGEEMAMRAMQKTQNK